MSTSVTIPLDTLTRLTQDLFVRAGMSESDAATLAEALIWANLRGVDTHGISRVPWYADLIKKGLLNPKPKLSLRKETAATVSIDADRASGPVAMRFAAGHAVRKAREAGACFAVVAHTTHTAALGFYARDIARQGCAALIAAASLPMMPYHGSAASSVSTSPLCIAVPRGQGEPLVLDIATSVISFGKLMLMKKAGKPLEPGWAIDASGAPTTDSAAAVMPLPLGGPKGAGLSLMIECLASLLADNPILSNVLDGSDTVHRQNALILAIDIAAFVELDTFQANVDLLVAGLKATPLGIGFSEILMPGERGDREMDVRRRTGIPVPAAAFADFRRVATEFGVAVPERF
jgi:ureidoglycolate dehydrogenase (NAD+)